MSTEKMRNDFEQFIIRRDGSIWVTVMGDQRSYNEPIERDFSTWCESRAAIEVELPEAFCAYGGQGHHGSDPDDAYIVEDVVRAIESLGLKVKPC